jgi:hypothetical protein
MKEFPETTERDARWVSQPVWTHYGKRPSSAPASLNAQPIVQPLYRKHYTPSPLFKNCDIHDSNNTELNDWSSIPGRIKHIFTTTSRLAPGKYV